MPRPRYAPLIVVAALSLASACSRGEAAVPLANGPAPSHATQPAAARPQLVFFMNPNGMPCKLQDGILREMGAELSARADLVYYRTTEPAEISRFQQFGIRSLPMLIVTDSAGRELRRATPGIHSMTEVLRLLQP